MTSTLRRRLVRAAAALLALILLPLTAITGSAATATFTNPLNSSGPDPWMTYHDGYYYLMTTPWSGPITMRKAPTIEALKGAAAVPVYDDFPASRGSNVWAPEFHLIDGPNGPRWYIYYSAGSGSIEAQRVHVAESAGTDPMGPYTYKGMVFGANDWWGIDGSPVTINGQLYFLWSGVPAQWTGADPSIYIVAMGNPWTVTGARTAISTPTHAWERQGTPMNEGPVALQHDGRTFVTYSASACQGPDYKLGLLTLTGSNPLSASSWTKNATPVFQRNDANGVYGPGHNGFFTSPDGTESWIVYHANASSTQGCGSTRTPRIQKFTWNADGTPNFGVPVAASTVLNVPSGEPVVTYQRIQSYNAQDRYVRHANFEARIDANVSPVADSRFRVVQGLADNGTGYVSFESANYPGYFLRHQDYQLVLARDDGTELFEADATFKQVPGLASSSWVSFQSYNFPDRYLRHYNYRLRIDTISTDQGRADATFRFAG
ncbi:family 43 glycosylhydrolase [Antribacter sp. KLBMP9083]|uniref:Family 43 glycosylhydrolase n=1 Tax=Antribacter soli TaxID=2910976 RepID=A0AA41U8K0_9MICO|nr:family 43 glycosylhydrolase [Antribacter soli]MCF4122505.1 family 43 glycosylhydrolase [Antribacter soli]